MWKLAPPVVGMQGRGDYKHDCFACLFVSSLPSFFLLSLSPFLPPSLPPSFLSLSLPLSFSPPPLSPPSPPPSPGTLPTFKTVSVQLLPPHKAQHSDRVPPAWAGHVTLHYRLQGTTDKGCHLWSGSCCGSPRIRVRHKTHFPLTFGFFLNFALCHCINPAKERGT